MSSLRQIQNGGEAEERTEESKGLTVKPVDSDFHSGNDSLVTCSLPRANLTSLKLHEFSDLVDFLDPA
jgi:hypothetical protein